MKKNKTLFIGILTILFWLGFFYLIIISHFKYSPINISKKHTKEFFFIAPQGWGFFTKNPRYERVNVYSFDSIKGLNKITIQNFSSKNLYGLKRQNRQYFNEIFSSLNSLRLNDSIWYVTKSNLDELNISNIPKIESINKFKEPLICGKYLIEKFEPIPWAWSTNLNYKNSKKYIVINVSCE